MLAAEVEGIAAEGQGTASTRARTDPNDRHPDGPGTATMSAEIDLIVRRDQDDQETGMDSVKTDPSDCQALGELGIRRMTMRVGLVDHLEPGDPGTQRSTEVIELGGTGEQVNLPPPLHPQLLRLG